MTAQQEQEQEEPALDDVRDRYLDWDIMLVFGGYLAVPKGAPVIFATFLSTIAERLADLAGGQQPGGDDTIAKAHLANAVQELTGCDSDHAEALAAEVWPPFRQTVNAAVQQ